MWTGFTDASDSHVGQDWDTWLWCPVRQLAELDRPEVGEEMALPVRKVQTFKTDRYPGYHCGVNIYVEPASPTEDENA